MNQILTLLSLYSEFIVCLLAVSVFSLWIGWMMNKSSFKKAMGRAERSWEHRLLSMEDTALNDTENLEEQLQELAGETRTLKATNRVLNDTIKKNDVAIQKARAEAIELNRQHAETQERLQRIIQQKDREILEFGNTASPQSKANIHPGSTFTAPIAGSMSSLAADETHALVDEFEETVAATQNTITESEFEATIAFTKDNDFDDASTVAMNPLDLMDSTVQMTASEFIHQRDNTSEKTLDKDFDEFIEDTADLSARYIDDFEESTVALDEDSLELAKRPYPVSNVD